jgi:hypothetical protein
MKQATGFDDRGTFRMFRESYTSTQLRKPNSQKMKLLVPNHISWSKTSSSQVTAPAVIRRGAIFLREMLNPSKGPGTKGKALHKSQARKISGFHGGDYEEYRVVGYKNPFRTSQETYCVSATYPSRWDIHGSDYEEYRLLGYKNPVRTS